MVKVKKFKQTEKFLIAMVDIEKYTTYRCDNDGVYQLRKGVYDNGLCRYCSQVNQPLENIDQLKIDFSKELKLT